MIDEMKNFLVSAVGGKVLLGAEWTITFSVQPLLFGRADFNTAQLFMADMFYCLRNDDVVGFNQRLALANKVTNLAASYIKVWLRDDFLFDKPDVRKVLYVLARLVGTEVLVSSSPVVIAILSLEEKYSFQGCFNQDLILWSQKRSQEIKDKEKAIAVVQPDPSQSVQPAASISEVQPVASLQTSLEPESSMTNTLPQSREEMSLDEVQSMSNELTRRLWEAVERRDTTGLADALLAGADPNACNLSDRKDRWAPLHFCAHDGDLKILGALLQGGASINRKTRRMRFTPLHLAGMWGRMDCVRALLESGADPDLEDVSGRTAYNLAKSHKHHAVASFIKNWIARHKTHQYFAAVQPYYPTPPPWFYY